MMKRDVDTQELLNIANDMADAARTVILPYFRSNDLDTSNKDALGYDPVTVADKAAEEVMRQILHERRPQDAILGEEYGHQTGTSGLTWVLDPIDGTRAFVSGTPTWGVLIALGDEEGPKIGVIDQPYTGERFIGTQSSAQLIRNGQQQTINTRASRPLAEGILFSTFPEVGTAKERAGFEAVSGQVQLTRFGMDCYAYALLAMGQIDLVIEAGLNAYDIQAPIALIEAAGGIVTNWQGEPAHQGGQVLAAANVEIHRETLDILKEFA